VSDLSIHLATQVWTRIPVAALPCAGWLTDVPRPSPTTLELSSYKGPGLQVPVQQAKYDVSTKASRFRQDSSVMTSRLKQPGRWPFHQPALTDVVRTSFHHAHARDNRSRRGVKIRAATVSDRQATRALSPIWISSPVTEYRLRHL
jgi:hypothetical protein